jgi:hypothetical protein
MYYILFSRPLQTKARRSLTFSDIHFSILKLEFDRQSRNQEFDRQSRNQEFVLNN